MTESPSPLTMLFSRHTKRRTFIAGLGCAAAWPLMTRAQQPAVPVIGWLSTRNSQTDAYVLPAFRRGLNGQGYVEGRNATIEYRWSDTQNDRLPALAADLVRHQVAVIAAAGTASSVVQAVQAITTTIPIVSAAVPSSGIAFNRPGSNVTGFYGFFGELGGKRIDLLRDVLPRASTIAVLTPLDASEELTDARKAARVLGLQIKLLVAGTVRDLDAALASLAQMRPDALMVTPSPLFFTRADKIVATAEQLALPAMYWRREFAMTGGLMSYGTDTDERFRAMGEYTGRILKGEKPGDLPIQQPTKFEFVINLKTAKALGLTIPETLLATADEVIQ
jgi:putative tryptophan/tyrosine transport system substrate-binding protein